MTAPPGISDIDVAAARLSGLTVETSLIESPELNKRYGGRILFKPEMLQRTGSFKIRGAYNKLSSLRACPAIHAFFPSAREESKTWMSGTRPGMTG